MCMMATVKPAMTSYRMFFFQSYFGSQLRMGTARAGGLSNIESSNSALIYISGFTAHNTFPAVL